MALILNIDTSLETASVCLAKDAVAVKLLINENQRDHASWIHNAIHLALQDSGCLITELEAVAVSNGPGSYTGLRVGLATAKGLCYGLGIPLITISTLKMMATAVKHKASDLICPMIDARRMEVFTAVYNKDLLELSPAQAMIIDETSYTPFLSVHQILFCGSGSKKLQNILSSANAHFENLHSNAFHLAELAEINFQNKEFANLAYAEPLYIKEFYTAERKN